MKATSLYYEDVTVGEAIRPLYPYVDQMQMIEWGYASGNFYPGHWGYWFNRNKQPQDPAGQVKPGGQEPTMTGQFKTALFERMLMEWAGPKGWVKKMDVQYRVWDYLNELKGLTGKVTGKRVEEGKHLVDVELQMVNEKCEVTTRGSATVVLPAREKK